MWWIRSDPCGMFSAIFTIVLILYSQWVIVTVVLVPWYGWHWHCLAYTMMTIMALLCHSRAQFTDPGAVPRSMLPPAPPAIDPRASLEDRPLMPRTCRRCKTIKPYSSHHCSTCGRCIIRLDHHCPWINNCVAINNQKYFLLFLFYTLCCCIYSGVLLVARFISCTNNLRKCSLSTVQTALCIINFIEAVIFGLFVLIMTFDQLTAIFDNTPGIDALQHKPGVKKGRYQSLVDVFGERISWRWLLPLGLTPTILAEFRAQFDREETKIQPAHQQGSVHYFGNYHQSPSNGHYNQPHNLPTPSHDSNPASFSSPRIMPTDPTNRTDIDLMYQGPGQGRTLGQTFRQAEPQHGPSYNPMYQRSESAPCKPFQEDVEWPHDPELDDLEFDLDADDDEDGTNATLAGHSILSSRGQTGRS